MAEVPATVRRPLRFGSFELDLHSGELRKAGVLVGLQEQSLKVLAELLERPGDLVTREQLRQRLWPNGTFVDFEHGLNAVINRLRETLGDSAESPRFIQTVPRRGYRFIAPVDGATVDARTEDPTSMAVLEQRRLESGRTRMLPWIAGATAIVVIVLLVIAATWLRPSKSAGRERATESRAADEACRQRSVASLRSRRRAGRVRVVRRELRQHRHLRHVGRLDRCSAPDDGSGGRLRTELVARRPPYRIPPQNGQCRAHSRDVGTRWARFAGQRISGGRDRSEFAHYGAHHLVARRAVCGRGSRPARCARRFRRHLSDSNRRRGASCDHAAEGSHVSFLAQFFRRTVAASRTRRATRPG